MTNDAPYQDSTELHRALPATQSWWLPELPTSI
jgi:hypothetical protein